MNLIDRYIEDLKPHVQVIGLHAQSYTERVIARLDGIREAVEDKQVWVDNGSYTFNADVLTSTIIDNLRTDELWILNSISAASVANPIRVRLDGKVVYQLPANQVVGLIAVYFIGPGDLSVEVDTTATNLSVQFKRFSRRTSVRSNRLGFEQPVPEVDRMGMAENHRHAGAMP